MRSSARSTATSLALASLLALVSACAHAAGANTADGAQPPDRPAPDPAVVSAEDIEQAPRAPLLQGRIAGVQVIPTSGGVQVRIRGTTSIRGNNEPLYIIDGVEVQPDANGTLPIAANDIFSIRVLKDAIDTTFYGVRGANGVVVIRTKQPSD